MYRNWLIAIKNYKINKNLKWEKNAISTKSVKTTYNSRLTSNIFLYSEKKTTK